MFNNDSVVFEIGYKVDERFRGGSWDKHDQLCDDTVDISIGSISYKDHGEIVRLKSVSIKLQKLRISLYVTGDDLVDSFNQCSTPHEVSKLSIHLIKNHCTAEEMLEILEKSSTFNYNLGKLAGISEWQGKLRKLAGF